MLVTQLNPPALLPPLFKPTPTAEADAIVLNVLGVLLQTSLSFFSQPGNMESVSFSSPICIYVAEHNRIES